MKLISRIFLPVFLLLVTSVKADQVFLLDDVDTSNFANKTSSPLAIRPTEYQVFEHALNEYHHYYPRDGQASCFDFAVTPFYKRYSVNDSKIDPLNIFGAFAQVQWNWGDVWLRANTALMHMKQKTKITTDTMCHENDKSVTTIDDITLKLGYDHYFNGDDHLGIYAMGVLPTNGSIKFPFGPKAPANDTADKKENKFDIPQIGVGNFRVGAGLNGGLTLHECGDKHLAFLFDANYQYAFKRAVEFGSKEDKNKDSEIQFTTGHTINAWTAFNYATGCWNFEVGSAFATTFGSKLDIEAIKKDDEKSPSNTTPKETVDLTMLFDKNSNVVSFSAQPYVAVGYNTTVCDNPVTLGLGVGYDFNKLHKDHAPNKFHGVTTWLSAAVSF